MHLYYIIFFFIFFSKVLQAQTVKVIALSSLYKIESHNSKQVDSILTLLNDLEKIYFVRFVHVDNIREDDQNGGFWSKTKNKFPLDTIMYNLELSWLKNKYSAKLMEETKKGILGDPSMTSNNIKNINQLYEFIELAIKSIDSKKIPKRNIRTDFSSFTKDTTTSTENIIVKTIDDLQHLNISNHQDSLERNYLMALYYFRLAAISNIEDRNKKLDSCKIMLKLAKDFNEIKIAHLHLKCQQYRQFSQDYFDASTVEKWWKSLPASDSTKLLKLLKKKYRNNNMSSIDFIFNMTTQNIEVSMGEDTILDIFEYLLSQSSFKVEINCSNLNLSQLQADKLSSDFKKNKPKPLLTVKSKDLSKNDNKHIKLAEIFDIETAK
jgi:hypothetical protein